MPIIKQTDWVPPVTTTHTTMQQLNERPYRTYRELLMADDGQGNPIPYSYAVVSGHTVTLRIPHALSDPALAPGAGGPFVAGAAANRIPDVVVPVTVAPSTETPTVHMALLWEPGLAVANRPSTGMWADENYVYIVLYNDAQATRTHRFVIYVEYTHSAITNEIVPETLGLVRDYVQPN